MLEPVEATYTHTHASRPWKHTFAPILHALSHLNCAILRIGFHVIYVSFHMFLTKSFLSLSVHAYVRGYHHNFDLLSVINNFFKLNDIKSFTKHTAQLQFFILNIYSWRAIYVLSKCCWKIERFYGQRNVHSFVKICIWLLHSIINLQ